MTVDIKEALSQKVGPLPAVAWGGLVGGGYVLYRYYKARQVASSGALQTVDTQGPAFGLSQDGSIPIAGGTGSGTSVVTPTTTLGQSMSNVDWGTMAENWGIGQGFNPTDVSTALGSYLYGTGQQLNSTQSAILQSALRHFGNPPEGVIIPPPTTPSPSLIPSAPTAAPPAPPAPVPLGQFFDPGGNLQVNQPPQPTYTYWLASGQPVTVPQGTPMPVGAYDSPPQYWGH